MSSKKKNGEDGPITIKKYANRRLYNTATSSYVTLDHLCQMVQEDVDFVVYDAKTGDDITRAVLTQIIVEEEAKGQNLLPINFLRQLIGFYGDNMQWMVPRYLEHMMEGFATNQEKLRQSMQETFGGIFPFGNLEEMGKQNMAMFENAMKLWTPPAPDASSDDAKESGAPDTKTDSDAASSESLDDLKTKVEELQKQLEVISKSEKKGS
ncbi:polyhydroxyalkanoate synthesis repressor PhaR [Denitrobaculum tricleocarpae]|uniref:Polyhydroxyalkanoate synthesis repressor PhaR n=1 Tax=Denitrobaculum tricleocarpae TaxID=2591009 RepID=A0A545U1V5_9PROT|nr:polyhydroxyalkanoate synthesis repressor PhaR [Denitrobaculum tricleocarpae]TQV83383.1 polyhydroxyalkanoate synthesis repressor PhaR [Denitrobaculum tricleocarpae]